jgi:hypothetical protein
MSGTVQDAITSAFTSSGAVATGVVVAGAAAAWGIKALWVAWRAGNKATNKIGT